MTGTISGYRVYTQKGNNIHSIRSADGVDIGEIKVGDFDNNSKADLFITGEDGSDGPMSSVLLSKQGTFLEDEENYKSIPGMEDTHSSIFDFDYDGVSDILIKGESESSGSLFNIYNTMKTKIDTASLSLDSSWIGKFKASHIDKDRHPEIIFYNDGGVYVNEVRVETDSLFRFHEIERMRVKKVNLDYINNDALKDLIVIGYPEGDDSGTARGYIQTSDGFQLIKEMPVDIETDDCISIFDLDGDGDNNIVIADGLGGRPYIKNYDFNDPHYDYHSIDGVPPTECISHQVADIDGDNALELYMSNEKYGTIGPDQMAHVYDLVNR